MTYFKKIALIVLLAVVLAGGGYYAWQKNEIGITGDRESPLSPPVFDPANASSGLFQAKMGFSNDLQFPVFVAENTSDSTTGCTKIKSGKFAYYSRDNVTIKSIKDSIKVPTSKRSSDVFIAYYSTTDNKFHFYPGESNTPGLEIISKRGFVPITSDSAEILGHDSFIIYSSTDVYSCGIGLIGDLAPFGNKASDRDDFVNDYKKLRSRGDGWVLSGIPSPDVVCELIKNGSNIVYFQPANLSYPAQSAETLGLKSKCASPTVVTELSSISSSYHFVWVHPTISNAATGEGGKFSSTKQVEELAEDVKRNNCGDGALQVGEVCDPGMGDNCKSDCTCLSGFVPDKLNGGCKRNTIGSYGQDLNAINSNCGNGRLDKGEDCDPIMEQHPGNECLSTCKCKPGDVPNTNGGCAKDIGTCGNGKLEGHEICDGEGCNSYCRGCNDGYFLRNKKCVVICNNDNNCDQQENYDNCHSDCNENHPSMLIPDSKIENMTAFFGPTCSSYVGSGYEIAKNSCAFTNIGDVVPPNFANFKISTITKNYSGEDDLCKISLTGITSVPAHSVAITFTCRKTSENWFVNEGESK